MIKKMLRAAAVGYLLTIGVAVSSADAQDLERVTIASNNDELTVAVLNIARQAGLFAEEGLELDHVTPGSGPRVAAAVMGGSADFALTSFSHVIQAVEEGGDIIAIARGFDAIPYNVVLSPAAIEKTGATPDVPFNERVRKLQGLKIAISGPGGATDQFIRIMLQARDVNPDDALQLLPMKTGVNMLAALENGSTDGFIWGAPASQAAEMQNVGKVVIHSSEVPETQDVILLVTATSGKILREQPELAEKVVRIFAKAMKIAENEPERAHELLQQHYADTEPGLFTEMWNDYREMLPREPVIRPEHLTASLTWLNTAERLSLATPFEKVVNTEIAERIAKEVQ